MAAGCAPANYPTASCPIPCTPRLMPYSIPAWRTTSIGRSDAKPLTVRFDVVNLFDQIYELRDGSGIGVFAPQYRRAPRLLRRHLAEAVTPVASIQATRTWARKRSTSARSRPDFAASSLPALSTASATCPVLIGGVGDLHDARRNLARALRRGIGAAGDFLADGILLLHRDRDFVGILVELADRSGNRLHGRTTLDVVTSIEEICCVMSPVAFSVCAARLLTSWATTAKPRPAIAGARRLDRRIERQQIGLRRHVADEIADVIDLPDRRGQSFDRIDNRAWPRRSPDGRCRPRRAPDWRSAPPTARFLPPPWRHC